MVCQAIDWAELRELMPVLIEAVADPTLDLDAAVSAMGRAGRWADWQIAYACQSMHELRQKIREALDTWPPADVAAFADRVAKRVSLSPEQHERLNAALRAAQRRSIDR